MPFPPVPSYPAALDSDYSLFLVYNTTETRLAADNSPWAQEIDIAPVNADRPEIWADNGFANISDELLYYDSVEKDSNGKVNKLKGCARQIGGQKTQFNKQGTWIRSYVVAEHHNQLVNAILKTQDFVGFNFDPRQKTLDWRIRNLLALDVIFDDFNCPDINFTFNVTNIDPVTGTTVSYLIQASPPGAIGSFRLDFGDGQFTTTQLQGTHTYAANAKIDPVVTISNSQCQIIQTPVQRTNPAQPAPSVQTVFDIPVTEAPPYPDFTVVPCNVPEPDINLPPLVIPCISIEGQLGPIPSVITGPTINMVSHVTITSNNPINITQSIVSIIGPNIPSIILIEPPIPPTIIIDPPIPPTIVILPPPSNIDLAINFDAVDMPNIAVDWGTPPEMEVGLTFARAVKTPERFANDLAIQKEFGEEFADLFEVNQTMKVEYEPVGIPSEIKVIMPDDPNIKLDMGDLFSKKIQIETKGLDIPKEIKIYGPESPIPTSIKFDASDLIGAVEMLQNIKPWKLDVSDVPRSIKVEMEKEIPHAIIVEMKEPIPEKIMVDGFPDSIRLVGPESIALVLPENIGIPVIFPEEMPKIEMFYSGAPIDVKISLNEIVNKEADGKQCVMIVPCSR